MWAGPLRGPGVGLSLIDPGLGCELRTCFSCGPSRQVGRRGGARRGGAGREGAGRALPPQVRRCAGARALLEAP